MNVAQAPERERSSTTSERSLNGYAATMAAYTFVVAVVTVLGALTNRQLPRAMTVRELVITAFAAHKLSRTVTKDAVTTPLRAPFTQHAGDGGPGEVMEKPQASDGVKHSIGELLTCPFCFDVWVITGFTIGHVFAPRATRMVADAMAALAGADFLQLAYATAQQVAEG
ncbi:DUF1360 domain-containing protein [Rhodococcus sp. NPDC019627]|jgi:hypothetical protein|uniref:DUF1360 domain-containing protein n=1 Tax=unclassified Rhodococcus (in: high G+C Gram-positive bacteria) TaxID=192944 RepID=UPI00131F83CC|nr:MULTISPECIES: DUF1360 domain-containing protein [unclassified Rhodococcus (in: high G+C Gram-positive bacteria)]QHE70104.1 hypothetical protein GFS60_03683 [Rhodococcus sp. WAY2]